tara:strand:+ start:1670 stop:2308 length:639 start_codon:yes stop_codon:yes gene_type:complete
MNRYLYKSIFFGFFLFLTFLSAQDLKNKNGENILPEEGDWSIGTSAHPLFNFVSNVFSEPAGDVLITMPSFGDDLYFYIKNFTSHDRAVRYIVGANFDMKEETWNMGLGYGVENRKGKTRLQGMWGYTGFIGVGDTFETGDWLSIPTSIYEDTYNMNIAASLFVGCEYFFLAKMAIGAEYHYGCNLTIDNNQTNFRIGNNANSTVLKINFYF